jgi:hypothetical protein
VGAVTALPCRIIHVPGKHEAELSVDVTILNRNIHLLRQIPAEVKKGHPEYYFFNSKSLENLAIFEKDEFELQSPVQGAQNVQKTVSSHIANQNTLLITIAWIYQRINQVLQNIWVCI